MTKYGAYDPLYPNGIVAIAGEQEIFGVRFLAADRADHHVVREKGFPFRTISIHSVRSEDHLDFSWKIHGKQVRLSWRRLSDDVVFGRVEFDEGLEILAEMYLPWESRHSYREWPNFTVQGPGIFAGELISPYRDDGNNAVIFASDQAPDRAQGYNHRFRQYDDFEQAGTLRNLSPGSIWGDMGVNWFLGAHFTRSFSFVLQNGRAADLAAQPAETYEALLRTGKESQNQPPRAMTGSGILSAISAAFSSILPFNAIYKAHTGRRFIMVDRTWSRCEEGWGIQFNWDTFLSSWSAAWVDPGLAMENMLSGYDAQLPDGKIPLHIRPGKEHAAEPPITAGRSQHIVQALTLWKTYLHTKDKAWAERCYPHAKKANMWWFSDRGDGQKYRDPLDWGLLGFGYDPEAEMGILGARIQPYAGKAQYAYFETYDDSPQWTTGEYFKSISNSRDVTEDDVNDEARYIARYHTADIYTLERCCLYAVDCECLSKLAHALGYREDAALFAEKHRQMTRRINERMWCEEDGCYYNLKFDGSFSKKQSPDCFMPLMTGGVPDERKARLLSILKDETKFWGEYMIPSIARDDPAFSDQAYWRGQIWPPQVLWTYLGLKRSGESVLAWELANKAGIMLAREWQERGFTPENYNAVTGRCSGAAHYNWGVLMGLPLLEELVAFTEDRIIFGNPLVADKTELSGIYADGRYYSLRIDNGVTAVFCDGACIAQKQGYVEIMRQS